MGQLRKRGHTWWIRYYRNGRRFEESSRSEKYTDAERLLKIREGKIAEGAPISPAIGRLRFEEATADVVADYRINRKRSIRQLERRITLHLTPFFGGRRMVNLTTADVRAYIARRQAANASNAEINRELAILKRAFRLAMQAGKLLYRPHIPMLEEHNVRTGFFERDEFEAVRSRLREYLRPVVTFAYLTGWRVPSEVLPLQWRQVDLKAGIVRLDPGATKNDEGRTFPFGQVLPTLRDVLEHQRALTEQLERETGQIIPWVFHRRGRCVRDFRNAWGKACEAAGCPGRIPHDFRRTAVRNLVRAGVPERVAMQLTGHKTRAVFDRYNIVSEADLQEGVRKLGAALTGTISGTIAPSGWVKRFKSRRK